MTHSCRVGLVYLYSRSVPVLSEIENEKASRMERIELHPLVAFASIAALFCSILEIATLEYLDAFRLCMTPWEIASEVSAALVMLVGVSGAWWLCMLLKGLGAVPRTKRYSASNTELWRVTPGLLKPMVFKRLAVVRVSGFHSLPHKPIPR
jgi:hypothetical protein